MWFKIPEDEEDEEYTAILHKETCDMLDVTQSVLETLLVFLSSSLIEIGPNGYGKVSFTASFPSQAQIRML